MSVRVSVFECVCLSVFECVCCVGNLVLDGNV